MCTISDWRTLTEANVYIRFTPSTRDYDAIDENNPGTFADITELMNRTQGVTPRIGICNVRSLTGEWRTQRVGPFVSTGGWDWWRAGWNDVLELSCINN